MVVIRRQTNHKHNTTIMFPILVILLCVNSNVLSSDNKIHLESTTAKSTKFNRSSIVSFNEIKPFIILNLSSQPAKNQTTTTTDKSLIDLFENLTIKNEGDEIEKIYLSNQTLEITMNSTIIEQALHHLFNEGRFIRNIWLYTSGLTTFFVLTIIFCIKYICKNCREPSNGHPINRSSERDDDGMSEIQDLLQNNVWNLKNIKKATLPFEPTIHRTIDTDIK